MAASLNKHRYGLIYVLLPNESLFAGYRFRAQVQHEAVLTILAVKRYCCATGNYPATLEELVQRGYLDGVPMDPFSDGPLVYKGTDESFLLYSVSENFVDDNGTPGRNKDGQIDGRYHDKGDLAFWPAQGYQ